MVIVFDYSAIASNAYSNAGASSSSDIAIPSGWTRIDFMAQPSSTGFYYALYINTKSH